MQDAPQAAWMQGAITVEQEGAAARREFIQRTYVHFLVGLMAFCGVVWGVIHSPLLGIMMGVNPLVWFAGLVGLSFAYRWFFASANMKVHYVGYGLTIALQGAICAPLFAYALAVSETILRDAFMLTALGFGGLTAYVLVSKKDFSFLGGFLTIATLVLLGISLLGLLFGGFNMGLLWSGLVILIFGGWVLYDTSMIVHHLPLNGYVFGATMLFIDFVILLRQVIFILLSLAWE